MFNTPGSMDTANSKLDTIEKRDIEGYPSTSWKVNRKGKIRFIPPQVGILRKKGRSKVIHATIRKVNEKKKI